LDIEPCSDTKDRPNADPYERKHDNRKHSHTNSTISTLPNCTCATTTCSTNWTLAPDQLPHSTPTENFADHDVSPLVSPLRQRYSTKRQTLTPIPNANNIYNGILIIEKPKSYSAMPALLWTQSEPKQMCLQQTTNQLLQSNILTPGSGTITNLSWPKLFVNNT